MTKNTPLMIRFRLDISTKIIHVLLYPILSIKSTDSKEFSTENFQNLEKGRNESLYFAYFKSPIHLSPFLALLS